MRASYLRGRCVNVASAHDKRHQNASGEIFAGYFASSINIAEYLLKWCASIQAGITEIYHLLQRRIGPDPWRSYGRGALLTFI